MDYHLYKSNRKDKKYMVKFTNNNTGKINTIHFGAEGYSDYTINKDENRKERYILRHMNDKINDLNYSGAWSRWLLWGEKTLQASINEMQRRFLITIYNNT